MKAGYGKTVRPVCAADGGQLSLGASSDPTAMKPTNKAEGPPVARPAEEKHAAEPVERRAGTKGNADQQSTYRTQRRASVSQAPERIRQEASDRPAVIYLRWEPYAGKPHGRFCAGGVR